MNFSGRAFSRTVSVGVPGVRGASNGTAQGQEQAVLRSNRDHPFLLTMPTYGGTLAAARCLGQHGISVTMAGEDAFPPARFSRFVTRWEKCPPILKVDRFYEWLIEFGRREPGYVLYPTCDDLAWLFAARANELGKYFRLYQPHADTILQLLDKKTLYELCDTLGIPTVPTVFPADRREALRLANQVGFPLLLKARTQILLKARTKGDFVSAYSDLAKAYDRFLEGNPFHPTLMKIVPGIERPLLQAFRSDAAQNIYSISGFAAEDGRMAVRASVKVLQRPRRLGIGLCFEEALVDPSALDGIRQLCQTTGYFGVFEAEFVREEGKFRLIDFNPRFYGQMGFEVARDLPLGYLSWLGALGDRAALNAALDAAGAWQEGQGYVYCNRFFFNLLVALQSFSGWMSPSESDRWKNWLEEATKNDLAFDSVDSPNDHLPALVSAANEIYWAVRHPRSFIRQHVIGP